MPIVPQVCGHICKCYSVAAQFEECREKIIEMPNIIRDLCHILYYGKVRVLHLLCVLYSSFSFQQFELKIAISNFPLFLSGSLKDCSPGGSVRQLLCGGFLPTDPSVPRWCALAPAGLSVQLRLHSRGEWRAG